MIYNLYLIITLYICDVPIYINILHKYIIYVHMLYDYIYITYNISLDTKYANPPTIVPKKKSKRHQHYTNTNNNDNFDNNKGRTGKTGTKSSTTPIKYIKYENLNKEFHNGKNIRRYLHFCQKCKYQNSHSWEYCRGNKDAKPKPAQLPISNIFNRNYLKNYNNFKNLHYLIKRNDNPPELQTKIFNNFRKYNKGLVSKYFDKIKSERQNKSNNNPYFNKNNNNNNNKSNKIYNKTPQINNTNNNRNNKLYTISDKRREYYNKFTHEPFTNSTDYWVRAPSNWFYNLTTRQIGKLAEFPVIGTAPQLSAVEWAELQQHFNVCFP